MNGPCRTCGEPAEYGLIVLENESLVLFCYGCLALSVMGKDPRETPRGDWEFKGQFLFKFPVEEEA